jgi:hypothetical protein
LDVDVSFSKDERQTIYAYVEHCHASVEHGPRGKRLPPGLAKKVARGGELPPGWQTRCVRGHVMPVEVLERCHPMPPKLRATLPPPPGTISVTIGGKVVRLLQATCEILDVFDVHVGR